MKYSDRGEEENTVRQYSNGDATTLVVAPHWHSDPREIT